MVYTRIMVENMNVFEKFISGLVKLISRDEMYIYISFLIICILFVTKLIITEIVWVVLPLNMNN